MANFTPADDCKGLVVYTAIFGDIGDQLHKPQQLPSDVHLHAYVDGVTEPMLDESTGWWLLPPKWEHATNPRLRARRHKLLSHELYPQVDYSLWLDGCLTLLDNPYRMVDRYLTDGLDICVFEHMQRQCVYEESAACNKLRKDDPQILQQVVQRYIQEGYPSANGLGETTAVLRRHSDKVKEFNEAWWEELRNNSIRDQMSFDYLIWKLKMDYATFEGTRCASPHFKWRAHR